MLEDLLCGNSVGARACGQRAFLDCRIDVGRPDGDRVVAVADQLESAKLLWEVLERRGFDLPETELGSRRIGRFERCDGVHVAVSGDPQQQIRIVVQLGNQRLFGQRRIDTPAAIGTGQLNADRHVRCDDHQLAFGLTPIKLADKPVITFLVQRRMAIATDIRRVIALRVVKHDHLERQTRLGLKAVAGKVLVNVGLGKTVPSRVGRAAQKLAHPLSLGKRTTIRIRRGYFGWCGKTSHWANANDVSVRRCAVDGAHVETQAVTAARVREQVPHLKNIHANVRLANALAVGTRAHEKMIVIANGLIPGNGLVKAGCLVRFLVINAVLTAMRAGTGTDDLAIHDIDVPACLVVLVVVQGVTE